jgi:cytochrome c-type biogenesis protein
MEEGALFLTGTALWLGILTSISPCPLATNVAAISFIARDVGSTSRVVMNGVFYTLGRTLVYVLLGVVIVTSLLSVMETAQFLQVRMNQILGPLLILIGIFLLGFVRLPGLDLRLAERFGNRVGGIKGVGPVLLGALFALSFCPVSAGLFFGSLIPLSLGAGSTLLLPTLFGIGTAVPVLLFAGLVALGAKSVARAFGKLRAFETWARRVTGVVFILAGAYLSAVYLFGWWI